MLDRVLSPFREFGLVAGLFYGIDRACERIGAPIRLYFYELMVQPVAEKPILTPGLVKGIEIREVKPDDPALGLMPVTAGALKERFAKPTVCLGAFRDGRLIAYMWLCLGPYEEDEVRCLFVPMPEDQAVWDFDFYVVPEERLGLGFVCLWDGANAFLRERGYRFSCSRVTRFNIASRKAHNHFQWRRVGHALFLRASRFQAMAATIPPYFAATFDGTSRPVIRVWTDSKA